MQSCFKDAAEGSKAAPGLDGIVVSAELIEGHGAICDPAMKAASAISIYAFTIV